MRRLIGDYAMQRASVTTTGGRRLAVILTLVLVLTAPFLRAGQDPIDVLIANGRIIDGSGNPWFRADLGIRGGRIVAIGSLRDSAAAQAIDAQDSIVSPG